MSTISKLRTKSHYLMLLDCIYSFLEQKDISFEDFEIFIRKDFKPNYEFIKKLSKIF